jgi:copper(I)-binding protein
MKRRITAAIVIVGAIVALALWLWPKKSADMPGGIVVTGAWTAPNPMVGGTDAVYLEIANTGGAADTLTGAETPAADKADFHESKMEGDVMRMRRLDSVEIPAGGHVSFAPGGLHIMLTGLKAKLAEGGHFRLTLVFAHAGRIETDVEVHAHDSGMGDMGGMH